MDQSNLEVLTRQRNGINDTTDDPPLRCDNNIPIIQLLLTGGYNGTELRGLNLCRLYLKAYSLADLVTTNGKSLSQVAWRGNGIEGTGRQHLDWPQQGRPKETEWERWCAASQQCLQMTPNNKMTMQLTKWTDQDKEWVSFFNQQTERFFTQRTNQGWKFHRKANMQASRNSSMKFHSTNDSAEKPETAGVRASIEKQRSYFSRKAIAKTTIREEDTRTNQPLSKTNYKKLYSDFPSAQNGQY